MKVPDGFRGQSILVIPPRDDCWVGKDIEATVLQVLVRAGNNGEYGVQYQCAWWDGRTRKVEWLEECEVKPISENGPFMRLGFHAARN